MPGKITVSILNNSGILISPSGLEFGLSLSRLIPPAQAQLSPIFNNLADGSYYVWWRTIGTSWNETQVVKDVVACAAASNIQSLVQNYYQTIAVPAIQAVDANYQALAQLAITNINFINLNAADTINDGDLAINANENTSYINFLKIVGVFLNGQNILYANYTPDNNDLVTMIYQDSSTLKWRGSVANYQLSETDVLSLLIANN